MKGLYINSERCALVTIRGFCSSNNIQFLQVHDLHYQAPHRNPKDRNEQSIYKNFGKLGNTIATNQKNLLQKNTKKILSTLDTNLNHKI